MGLLGKRKVAKWLDNEVVVIATIPLLGILGRAGVEHNVVNLG